MFARLDGTVGGGARPRRRCRLALGDRGGGAAARDGLLNSVFKHLKKTNHAAAPAVVESGATGGAREGKAKEKKKKAYNS